MGSPHSDRYRQFLARLKAARIEAGLTQRAVGKALDMPQSVVWKSENGERRVDVVEFEQFAELYGKPLTYFLPRKR